MHILEISTMKYLNIIIQSTFLLLYSFSLCALSYCFIHTIVVIIRIISIILIIIIIIIRISIIIIVDDKIPVNHNLQIRNVGMIYFSSLSQL